MPTTKFLNSLKNGYREKLFFLTIFFTSCLFIDTASHIGANSTPAVFFFNYKYMWLKVVLSFLLPAAATLIYYLKTKNLVFIGDATATVMTIFSIFFVLDYLTLKVMWRIEKSIVIYHLGYGLITFFTVLGVVSLIALIRREGTPGYTVMCKAFFVGFTSVFVVCFVTIYFLNRTYNADSCIVNLIPFKGEFSTIKEFGFTNLVIRDIGNIGVFSALAMAILELTKKHRIAQAVLIPTVLSALMELYQFFEKCGDTDIDDIIANVAGAVFGIIIYKLVISKNKEKELC